MPVPIAVQRGIKAQARRRRQDDLQRKLDQAANNWSTENVDVLTLSEDNNLPFDVVQRNLSQVRQSATRPVPPPASYVMQQAPNTAQFLNTGYNAMAAVSDVEYLVEYEKELWNRRTKGNFQNTALGVLDRGKNLFGNLVEFAGNMYAGLDNTLNPLGIATPDVTFGDDGISFTFNTIPDEGQNVLQNLGERIGEIDVGYRPRFTWENYKGDMTAGNLAGFVLETGTQSLADMAAMFATLPAYLASYTEEIAEERIENIDGVDEVRLRDLAFSAAFAAVVSRLELSAAKGILGMLDETPVGKTVRRRVIRNDGRAVSTTEVTSGGMGVGYAAREIGRKSVLEASTEFLQEVIEYTGATLGTDQRMDLVTALDRGIAGAVAGAAMGGTIRAASLPANAAGLRFQRKIQKDISDLNDQESIDREIEIHNRITLGQKSPRKLREYMRGMADEDLFYFSPEEVELAIQEGLNVPDTMKEQLAADPNKDVELSVENASVDLFPDEKLTERLRPHMKLQPTARTAAEMQETSNTTMERLQGLMEQTARNAELRTEIDDIHKNIVEQLVASKQISRTTANASAAIIPSFVETSVSRLQKRGVKITPKEFFERFMKVKIESAEEMAAAEPGPTVLRQVTADPQTILERVPPAAMGRMPISVPEMTETGQIEMVERPANEALADIRSERDAYRQLLDCTRRVA